MPVRLIVLVDYKYQKVFIRHVLTHAEYNLAPLVELLGMIYRPYRYDFKNLKYFYRDFPSEIVARVEPLYCVQDLPDLVRKQQLAAEMFAQTLPLVEEALATI